MRGIYDDREGCQKEERREILNGITGYYFSLLSKGQNVYIFPSIPKGEIVDIVVFIDVKRVPE